MFTPRPSSEQKWVKNTHKWALDARNRHLRRQLSSCGRYAPLLQRSAAMSPNSTFLSYGNASKLPKMSTFRALMIQNYMKHYLGLPYHPNTTFSHHLPNYITLHMIKGSKINYPNLGFLNFSPLTTKITLIQYFQ